MAWRTRARDDGAGDSVRILPPSGSPAPGVGPGIPPPSQPHRQAWVMTGFAVATIAVLAGVLVAGNRGEPDPVVPSSVAPAVIAEPADPPADPPVPARPNIVTTSSWGVGALGESGGTVNDVAGDAGRFVAAGSEDAGPSGTRAAVWSSTSPTRWSGPADVESPDGVSSRIDAIVPFGDGWLGLGRVGLDVAAWAAADWTQWAFLGTVADLSGLQRVHDLAVLGDDLVAVGEGPDGHSLWTTSDGRSWSPLEFELGDGEARPTVAVSRDGWLYLGGASCRDGVCRPALWRTADGLEWSGVRGDAEHRLFAHPATTRLPSGELWPEAGEVRSIASSGSWLVAAGRTVDGETDAPAVWLSPDGLHWRPMPHAGPLAAARVAIRVIDVGADPPVADLNVGGRRLAVAPGDAIVTDVATIAVIDVADGAVILDAGDGPAEIRRGTSITIERSRRIEAVAVQADRILAAGVELTADGAESPVAWTSTDAGATWDLVPLPATVPVGAGHAALIRGRLGVMAAGPSATVWWNAWDTDASVAVAARVVDGFVSALGGGDIGGVMAALGPFAEESSAGMVAPAPGPVVLTPWKANGTIDVAAIEATLGYLGALDTSIELGVCDGSVRWGDPEQVSLRCPYAASSTLATMLGLDVDRGTLRATVEGGVVVELEATSTSDAAWRSLARWARRIDPVAATATFGPEDAAEPPTLDAGLAAAVLDWAGRYTEAFLAVGEPVETATPVGTILWSVVDPVEVGFIESVTFFDGEFIGRGQELSEDDETTPVAVRSTDGVTWRPMEGPPGVVWWWDPEVVGDELYARFDTGLGLATWDGERWTEVPLDVPTDGEWWVSSMAASGDTVLLTGEGWARSGDPLGYVTWLREPDGGFVRTELEGPELPAVVFGGNPLLVGTDAGFLLFTSSEPERAAVWSSPDGRTWALVVAELGIEGQWIERLFHLGGRYVAVVYEGEECSGTGVLESCTTRRGLWSSSDGAAWERTRGDVGALTIATASWGAVAVSHEDTWGPEPQVATPLTLLTSPDGRRWETVPDVVVGVPGASWHWVGETAASEHTIVIPIHGEFWTGSDAESDWIPPRSLLLVGRFVR